MSLRVLRWGENSGLTWWAQWKNVSPCRGKQEGQSERRSPDEGGAGWPLAKECGKLLVAKRGKETDSPLKSAEGTSPADLF